MKKTICVLWAVTALMFLVLCGCGSKSDSPSGSVNLANNSFSGLAVKAVQLTPSSSSNWGPNHLGANQAILSGNSLTFTDIAPGTYSMLVTLEDGQSLQWDILEVIDGEITFTQVSSAYKIAGKTVTNPDSPATEGATKEAPDKALNVSDQNVNEIVK